jgi:hypothetical protein
MDLRTTCKPAQVGRCVCPVARSPTGYAGHEFEWPQHANSAQCAQIDAALSVREWQHCHHAVIGESRVWGEYTREYLPAHNNYEIHYVPHGS